jgi:hypothetical protein
VDDASPDGTQDVAKSLTKVYGEDHIVRVPEMIESPMRAETEDENGGGSCFDREPGN